jgi:hypothetical protein
LTTPQVSFPADPISKGISRNPQRCGESQQQ